MCGKSVVPKSRTLHDLAMKLGVTRDKIEDPYTGIEITPGQKLHSIFTWEDQMVMTPMHFGFRMDGSLYNARSDSVGKPTWVASFARNRCIVPSDAFVEGNRLFASPDGSPLLLAGIYGTFSSENVFCVALLTTRANPCVSPVHHRMPVIVPEKGVRPWIAPTFNDSAAPLLGAFCEYTRDVDLRSIPIAA